MLGIDGEYTDCHSKGKPDGGARKSGKINCKTFHRKTYFS